MRSNEFRELSDAELEEKLDEFKHELFNLRFRLVTGQLDNPRLLQQTRKDIARVLTVQRERQLAASEAAQAEV